MHKSLEEKAWWAQGLKMGVDGGREGGEGKETSRQKVDYGLSEDWELSCPGWDW